MSTYNFDKIVDRKGTSSLKYDFGKERMGREDLLPLWVADMDFRLPDSVLDIIKSRVDHGIFGYTDPKEDYFESVQSWFRRRHGVTLQREWNTVAPGVVYALATAIRALTKEGEAVLIQEPVYYPFRESIEENDRICVNNQLVLRDGHYEIDFDDFEKKIVDNKVKVFLLCSPHNPAGRVWTREELTKAADICLKYGVEIIADEIHCDFVFPGYTFQSVAGLDEKYLEHIILCTSASKSFNIAGLQAANILIPNPELRRKYRKVNNANGYSQGNVLGMTAIQAVYDEGEEWFDQLLDYLTGNLNFLRAYLAEHLPEIKLVEPEGTYLVWLDCKGIVDNYEDLKQLIVEEAKLWLDDGAIFGEETSLFERINIACPRSVLGQALNQLEAAVRARKAK